MKVLFILPGVGREKQWGRWHKGAGNNNFNYGIASLAGFLKIRGMEVSLIDCQFLNDPEKDLGERIRSENPDLIGISCYTPTYTEAIRTASFCKKVQPKIKVVFGGAHPSLYPEETLRENPDIDFVVAGEGEVTLHELMRALQIEDSDFSPIRGLGYRIDGGIVINEKREIFRSLDELPMPAYNIFPLDQYRIQVTSYKRLPTYTMVASRGCPYSCTFCQVKQFLGSTMRYKSPPCLVEEIAYLKEHYQARGIMFQDSTFTFDWDWLREFCDLLIRKKMDITWMCFTRADRVNDEILELMKKAGCYGMSYGVESANQKSLDLLKKNIKIEKIIESVKLSIKKGFFVTATYILGIPGEDGSDVRKTIALANSLATHIAHFYLPIPYPESELFFQCKEDGGIRADLKWEDFNMFADENPVYINPRIGIKEMLSLKREAIKRYYMNPKVIYRNLRMIDSAEDIRKYYTAAKALLGFYRGQ